MKARADNTVGLVELFNRKKPLISSDHYGLLPVRSQEDGKSQTGEDTSKQLKTQTRSAPLPQRVVHAELRRDEDINQVVSMWRMDREQVFKQQQAKKAHSREKNAVALARHRQDRHAHIHVGHETFQAQKLNTYKQMKKRVTEIINTVPVRSKVKTKPYEVSLSEKQSGLEHPMDSETLEDYKELGLGIKWQKTDDKNDAKLEENNDLGIIWPKIDGKSDAKLEDRKDLGIIRPKINDKNGAKLKDHKGLGIIWQKIYGKNDAKLEDRRDLGTRQNTDDENGRPDSQVQGAHNEINKNSRSQEVTTIWKTISKTIPRSDQPFPWAETFTPFTQEEMKRKLKGTVRKIVERPGRSLVDVKPSLLGVHRLIKTDTAVTAHEVTCTDETCFDEQSTAPAKQPEYFQSAGIQCAYKSSESGHAIILADGCVYKKQLQMVWPLMGNPLQPLAVRKLRWVGLPIADDTENMAALPIDQQQCEVIEDWTIDGNDLLLRLQKAEEDYRHDINDEVEDNKAGWTGVPEFPSSPQELEAELYHPILVAEEWRRQKNYKFMPLEQVSEKSLHRILTTSTSSEASRLSAVATVIHVRAKFGRASEYVKLHEAAAARLGQKLVSEPELIACAIADTLDEIFCGYVSVRRAAAMTLLALGWETKQREKAVSIMNEAITETSLLDQSFAAIILAHVGEMSWKILKTVVSYWLNAYFKHDLFHSLLALRCLSKHGPLTASAVAESLNNLEHDVRIKTCFTLPFLKCSLTLDVQMRLREILDRDWHSGVRTSAAHALASLGLCGIVHSHITDLIASNQPHKTIEGLRLVLMLRVVSPLILETVLPCLKSELRSVRLAALEVVARLKIANIKFISPICQMTLDDDRTIRMGALQALGCIGIESPEVRKSVLSAVALDQDADVCRAAVNVVGLLKLCGPDVHEALWAAFEREDDPTHREDVTRVLRGTGVDVSELDKQPGRILREVEEARKIILNLAKQDSNWDNNQLRSSLKTLNHELRFSNIGLQKHIF